MNGGAGADTYVVTNINESGNTIGVDGRDFGVDEH